MENEMALSLIKLKSQTMRHVVVARNERQRKRERTKYVVPRLSRTKWLLNMMLGVASRVWAVHTGDRFQLSLSGGTFYYKPVLAQRSGINSSRLIGMRISRRS